MNRKRLIFIAILAAGVVVLGIALWLTRTPEPAPEPRVSDVPTEAIDEIGINLRDAVVALKREPDDGSWGVTTPVAARADIAHVKALLELAAATPTRRYDRDAIEDDVTGLDNPALTVRYNDNAPIAIGKPGPQPGTRYVRTAHALLLVDARSLSSLPTRWRGWISPTLLARDADLSKLTLPRLTLDRSETGGWRVLPDSADRGADYAQATIDAWRQSRALSLEPADAGRQRLARVTLRFGDDSRRHLDVIARKPELILRDAALGIDYHFADTLAAPLLDMRHPDSLGAGRGRSLQPSAIPLSPTEAGGEIGGDSG